MKILFVLLIVVMLLAQATGMKVHEAHHLFGFGANSFGRGTSLRSSGSDWTSLAKKTSGW